MHEKVLNLLYLNLNQIPTINFQNIELYFHPNDVILHGMRIWILL
jgi:hypothetical protein